MIVSQRTYSGYVHPLRRKFVSRKQFLFTLYRRCTPQDRRHSPPPSSPVSFIIVVVVIITIFICIYTFFFPEHVRFGAKRELISLLVSVFWTGKTDRRRHVNIFCHNAIHPFNYAPLCYFSLRRKPVFYFPCPRQVFGIVGIGNSPNLPVAAMTERKTGLAPRRQTDQ